MDVRWHRVVILGASLALGFWQGCTQERGLEPGPPKYYAYVSIIQDTSVIIMIDMDADTIVDSIRDPDWFELSIAADDRGPRCAVWELFRVQLFRGGETSPYGVVNTSGGSHGFTHNPDYLLNSRGGRGGVVSQEINFYDAVDLSVVYSDTFGLERPIIHEDEGLVYGLSSLATDDGTLIREDLAAYDYINRRIHRIWVINPDSLEKPYDLSHFTVDAAGRRLYATVNATTEYRLICYDLIADTLIFWNSIYRPFGDVRLTPNGREVWYADPGDGTHLGGGPETITIYDSETGAVLDVISTTALRPRPSLTIDPWKIRFHPSGEKAYVLCNPSLYGPVLVIDVSTRQVTKTFWIQDHRWMWDLEVVQVELP